jgi:hypothetical protein
VISSPDFAWGHFLQAKNADTRGRPEDALAPAEKAAAIDPSNMLFVDEVKSARRVVVVDGVASEAVSMRTTLAAVKEADADSRDLDNGTKLLLRMGIHNTDMKLLSADFDMEPAKSSEVEVLSRVFENEGTTIVALHVHNLTAEEFVLHGSDNLDKQAGACFAASGKRFEPDAEDSYWSFFARERACRTCEDVDIHIPPDAVAVPSFGVTASLAGLDRCVFYNVPSKGGTVVVRLGDRAKSAPG